MRAASVVRRLGRTAAAGGTGAAVFWGGYLSVVGFAAERAQRGIRADERPAHPSTRFRILVPAHDEEELLGATLDSLNALDFPSELVEVHVVADNCTDRTPEIARAKAVSVHERDSTLR